jgi:hypothetical protein
MDALVFKPAKKYNWYVYNKPPAKDNRWDLRGRFIMEIMWPKALFMESKMVTNNQSNKQNY